MLVPQRYSVAVPASTGPGKRDPGVVRCALKTVSARLDDVCVQHGVQWSEHFFLLGLGVS